MFILWLWRRWATSKIKGNWFGSLQFFKNMGWGVLGTVAASGGSGSRFTVQCPMMSNVLNIVWGQAFLKRRQQRKRGLISGKDSFYSSQTWDYIKLKGFCRYTDTLVRSVMHDWDGVLYYAYSCAVCGVIKGCVINLGQPLIQYHIIRKLNKWHESTVFFCSFVVGLFCVDGFEDSFGAGQI